MSSPYSNKIIQYPTKGVVIEDNFWYYGKPKTKAKVNIPAIMTLQEPSEPIIITEKKTNGRIHDKEVDKTLNYLEMYIPDFLYTFPTEEDLANNNQTVFGASKKYKHPISKKKMNSGKKGSTVKGMARVVRKNTRIIIIFLDGLAKAGNIICIGRLDDLQGDEDIEELALATLGNTGGISKLTAKSAMR